jgi:polyhydroxybutyrate depolymerase
VPLLVSLHGLGSNGSIQNAITYWSSFDEQVAASAPFVLVVPDGVSTLWLWGVEDSYDVRFIFDVIARVAAEGCIDRSRVYVDGWSEGAYMAQRMACASADPAVDPQGILVAAVHSYAGGDPAVIPALCRPTPGSRPTSVLLSQGLDDSLVDAQRMGFPAFQSWASRYSCSAPSAAFTVTQWLSGCHAGAAVDWWPISGFTHFTWSCPADVYWHDRGVWAFFTTRRAPTSTTCS